MPMDVMNQDRAYRRGLVLGLTMAEIVILVIFSLLLALVAVISTREAEIRQLRLVAGKGADVAPLVAKLQETFPAATNFDDLFQELTNEIDKARQRDRALKELADARKKYAELDALERVIADTSMQEGIQPADLARDAAEGRAGRAVRAALASAHLPEIQPADLSASLQSLANTAGTALHARQLERDVNTLKGQIENLRVKLSGSGKGTELPACWANATTGKPEYIFDIALNSDSLVVRDRKLAARAEDEAALPLSAISFGVPISADAFVSQTNALFAWSNAHQCRFFVTIFDQTGPGEKANYKRQARTVDLHFYKYEILDNRF